MVGTVGRDGRTNERRPRAFAKLAEGGPFSGGCSLANCEVP